MDDHLRSRRAGPSRLRIVAMEAKHIAELAQLEKLCFSRPWSYDALAAELSNPLAVFFVAEVDGSAVAYAGMYHIVDEGYITNIAVHPDYRGRGLGTALVRVLDAYAKDNGLAMLTLEVRPSNIVAVGIYKAAGFAKAGERRGFYDAPREDAVIMTKRY